jgi:hypothetical protein
MQKYLLILLLIVSGHLCAQDYKFGNVSLKELQETKDDVFDQANAKVIYREVEFEFGNVLYVFERIKIYNKEGFEHAKWDIDFDDVESLKAFTHNLEGGRIVSTKVDKESVFKVDVGDGVEKSKISFPNVKEGSVLEVKYKVRGIGLRSLNTQATIPIKNLFILLKNPYSYELKITENPLSKVDLAVNQKPYEILYRGANIRGMKEEKFVASTSTYLGKLYIEQVPSRGKNNLDDWGDVSKEYNNWLPFGQELKKDHFFRDDLRAFIKESMTPLEKAKAVFYYLQDRMQWNFYYSLGSENIRASYKDKKGSVSDINLTLTSMLRWVGLEANPLLLASIDKGYVLFPTVKGFNNTITALELDGKLYLLDASSKYNNFGEIRNVFINGNALIVYKDDSFKIVKTTPKVKSREISIITVDLNLKNASAVGSLKNRQTGYSAYDFRRKYLLKSKDAYTDFLIEEHPRLTPSNVQVEDFSDGKKPITLSYDINYKDCFEVIGDKIYLEPLLYFGIDTNEFNENERLYPIDFRYPYARTYTLNIKLPEGYKVEELPKPRKISLEANNASFSYNATVVGQILQIAFQMDINNALVRASYYEGYKQMFSEILKISQSKIVASKI